jgi:hypothetical protein
MRVDTDLDSIRARADFPSLIRDLATPDKPFTHGDYAFHQRIGRVLLDISDLLMDIASSPALVMHEQMLPRNTQGEHFPTG